MWYRKGTL
jgi:hypothetical protein